MKRRHRAQCLRAPHIYRAAMNLPYDSCALWLIFGEFFEETRVGKIARRGDGRRQCEYHYEDREGWSWRASSACCYSAFSVRPAHSGMSCTLSPATCLGSRHGNLFQIHESPSLMPGETSEERSLPLLPTFCWLRHSG